MSISEATPKKSASAKAKAASGGGLTVGEVLKEQGRNITKLTVALKEEVTKSAAQAKIIEEQGIVLKDLGTAVMALLADATERYNASGDTVSLDAALAYQAALDPVTFEHMYGVNPHTGVETGSSQSIFSAATTG